MGRKLTPVLIAAKEVWPDEHTWAKSENSFAPAFERWRRSIHSCRRPCYAVARTAVPQDSVQPRLESEFASSWFRSSDRRAASRAPRRCAQRERIRQPLCLKLREMFFPAVFALFADANIKGAILCRFGPAADSEGFVAPTVIRLVSEINSDGHSFEPPASLCKACKAMQLTQKM